MIKVRMLDADGNPTDEVRELDPCDAREYFEGGLAVAETGDQVAESVEAGAKKPAKKVAKKKAAKKTDAE